MVGLWMLALVANAGAVEPEGVVGERVEAAPTVQTTEALSLENPANHGFVLWIGATVEPVRFESDGYSGAVAAQAWLARRLGVEWAANVYTRPQSQTLTYDLTQLTQPTHLTGRLSDPAMSTDLRLQFAILDGAVQSRRGDVPITLTIDLGGGMVATRDDLQALQCDGTQGDPCTTVANQLHPTAVIGTGLTVAPSERVRIRGVLLYRGWVENLNGGELERMGSTGIGVDLGVQLGKSRSSKFEAPVPPIDPLYENGM